MFVQGRVEGEWEREGGKDETENFKKKAVFFPHRWRILCSSIYQMVGIVLLTWQASPRVEEDVEKCRGGVAEIEDRVHWLARWL